MSLQHLRTFVEVHRRGSITEAARLLGLTQPAVSAHVAALEAQLGRALFQRHARGVRPTAVADDLAAALGESLDMAERALATARARSTRLTGVVHLAGPAEFLAERVAPLLPGLFKTGLSLRIRTGNREQVFEALLAGSVDLALTASRAADPRVASAVIGAETLLAVTSRSGVDLGLNAPFVAYDSELPLVRDWLLANDLPLPEAPPAATAQDLRLLRSLTEAGTGWTVLPDYLCDAALASGRLLEIPAPKLRPANDFRLVWAKGSLRHPRVAYARDELLRALSSLR